MSDKVSMLTHPSNPYIITQPQRKIKQPSDNLLLHYYFTKCVSIPGGGKQTIVIAAPKAGQAAGTPGQQAGQQKIITTVPKGQQQGGAGGTQYIVVTTRPGAQQGNSSVLMDVGTFLCKEC